MTQAPPPRSLGDRLQAAFDWAATATLHPREDGPTVASLNRVAAALRQTAGQPEDRARVVRLLEPVARSIVDAWPYDDELGLEVLACLHLARELQRREG